MFSITAGDTGAVVIGIVCSTIIAWIPGTSVSYLGPSSYRTGGSPNPCGNKNRSNSNNDDGDNVDKNDNNNKIIIVIIVIIIVRVTTNIIFVYTPMP